MQCPHCSNDDASLMENIGWYLDHTGVSSAAMEQAWQYGDVVPEGARPVMRCEVCSKTFTIYKSTKV